MIAVRATFAEAFRFWMRCVRISPSPCLAIEASGDEGRHVEGLADVGADRRE